MLIHNYVSLVITYSPIQIFNMFSSDSEYMQRVNSYARRFENRSSILTQIEYNDALAKRNANKQTSSSVSDSTTGKTDSADTGSTAVNALNIASVTPVTADLNTLLNTGIGSNVNVII